MTQLAASQASILTKMALTATPRAWIDESVHRRNTVAIIVLNWNNARSTISCVESLGKITYPDAYVVIVDNGSEDDSIVQIRRRFPEHQVIETGENLGYAGGNWMGIKRALEQGADYVCVLNNDVIVTQGFLEPLIAASGGPAVSRVTTPLLCELDRPGTIWALGSKINPKLGSTERLFAGQARETVAARKPMPVEVCAGTALVIPRDILENVGFMDAAFFLYYEEIDWSFRLRKAGYQTMAVAESVVFHEVSATLGQKSPIIDYYMCRNHLHVLNRHWTGLIRLRMLVDAIASELRTVLAYTLKPWGGRRRPHRTARLMAIRDAALGRWGKMPPDVARICGDRRQ